MAFNAQFTVRVSKEVMEIMENHAKKHGLTLVALVRFVLTNWATSPTKDREDILDLIGQ